MLSTLVALLVPSKTQGAEVVINEILANNQSIAPLAEFPDYFPDYVELHNNTPDDIHLDAGWSLSTKKSPTPTDFRDHFYFPPGTIIPGDSNLLVFFDKQTNFPGIHTTWTVGGTNESFSLKRTGDQVLLFKNYAGSLVDSNAFGFQIPDYSIGRFPDFTGNFTLMLPTPCGGTIPCVTNTPVFFVSSPSVSNEVSLRFNEWLATNSAGANKDWFEIYNPDTNIVELSGLVFVDKLSNLTNPKKSRPIPGLCFIAPQGFAQFFASDTTAADPPVQEVAFSISSTSGDEMFMFANDKVTLLDHVRSTLIQKRDTSEGRVPDGGDLIIQLPKLSPEASNFGDITNAVINEVLTHTDPPLEDAIEFYNPTASPADISNFWLSNEPNHPMKYHVPPGTIIPAHGYKVFYEYQFDPDFTGNAPSFRFNSANGDQAWLFSALASGKLTGYRTGISFPSSANGISFGRYVTSVGKVEYVSMSSLSLGTSVTALDPPTYRDIFRTGLGATNPTPLVGPIVINEIHYHPPDLLSGTNYVDNAIDEFIELYNITGDDHPLYDPFVYRADRDYSADEVADHVAIRAGEEYADGRTNTWRVRGGVSFDFPMDIVLGAHKFLLVVNFDPTNTLVLNDFTNKFKIGGVPTQVKLFGPYKGKLSNGGASVDLYRPDPPQGPQHPDYHLVPRILIDHVKYSDRAPWPVLSAEGAISADGGGSSLQRISAYDFGDDPINWVADLPTPGRFNTQSGLEAPTIATQPRSQSVSAGSTVNFTVAARGQDLHYQWMFNGVALDGQTGTQLHMVNVSTNQSGGYQVAVTNVAGSVMSAEAILTVTASKPDTVKPTVQITGPAAPVQTNVAILITGKSSDNTGVNSVLYSVNGGSFNAATGSVTWANWGSPAPAVLHPGTNIIQAYAVDQAGNVSATNSKSYFLSVKIPLGVSINGQGSITGATNNQSIELGRNFTLTAVPALGYVFSNWTITTNMVVAEVRATPSLTYAMQSNLAVTASFITNPFIAHAGQFNGLFFASNAVAHGSSGFFNLAMTDHGAYTAKLLNDGRKLSASGQFDLFGRATNVIPRTGTNAITVAWQMDLGNSDTVGGQVTDGNWISGLAGDRAVFKAPAYLCPNAGKYTFFISGFAGSTTAPAGHSYGTATIDSNGVVKMSVSLADKTKGTQTAPLSKNGLWPLYVPQMKGSLISWVAFSNAPTADFSGLLDWNKLSNATAPYYKAGFSDQTTIAGSRYTPPPVGPTNKILQLTEGWAVFADGNLGQGQAYTNSFTLWPGNKVTNGGPDALTLTFTPASGLFKGTFKPGGSTKALALNGVVLQKGTNGFGAILGTNQSSNVSLQPAPGP